MLLAKSAVLWCFVAPLCMVISFVMGTGQSDRVTAVYSAVAIGVVPFGVLAVSAWLGIRYPYHPVPVRFRWSRRKEWKPMLLRWGTLVLLPYAVVPGLTIAFLAPSLLIWGLTSTSGLTQKLPDNDFGLGIGLACAIAVAAVLIGHRVSLRMIAGRRDALVAYLSDPLRG
jgi:polyferredoxin